MTYITDATVERSVKTLRNAIEAAENSNQAGENFVVAAAAAPELLEALTRLVHDINDLMSNSEGVAGLHLNGDLAPWSDLDEGGHFSPWLGQGIYQARTAISKARGAA